MNRRQILQAGESWALRGLSPTKLGVRKLWEDEIASLHFTTRCLSANGCRGVWCGGHASYAQASGRTYWLVAASVSEGRAGLRDYGCQ